MFASDGLGHGMSETLEEQEQLEDSVMFDATEMVSFKVLKMAFRYAVRFTWLMGALATWITIYGETGNRGLLGLTAQALSLPR